jgi:hypothetical protein
VDLSFLQAECAASGRVCSTAAFAAFGRVCSTLVCAVSVHGCVPVQQQPVLCQEVSGLLQTLLHLDMSGLARAAPVRVCQQELKLETEAKKLGN